MKMYQLECIKMKVKCFDYFFSFFARHLDGFFFYFSNENRVPDKSIVKFKYLSITILLCIRKKSQTFKKKERNNHLKIPL